MEGSHDDHGKLPRRRPRLPQDDPVVGPSPYRPWIHRHPRSGTPPGRIGHLVATDDRYRTRGERQGKEKEQASPLASLQALVTNGPRRFGPDNQIDKDSWAGAGFLCTHLVTSPINAMDLAHVALSGETEGARFNIEASPLVESGVKSECVQGHRETLVFPYLQMFPPHCSTCRCKPVGKGHRGHQR